MSAEEQTDQSDIEAVSSERERSTIGFPYGDLQDAVTIAKGIHAVAGSSCQMEQLAAHLKMAPNGGGFRLKTITAKIFGLTHYSQGVIKLTPLGSRVCDQRQESAAKVEAFLNVPLYRAIYEKYKSTSLPPTASALENEMASLGVSKKQTDKARQTFQRSALQAGFFAYGQDRLVLPTAANAKPGDTGPAASTETLNEKKDTGNGGDGGDGGGRHQLIEGLIKTLPDEGKEWSTRERQKWLQLAAGIFDFVYTRPTDDKASLAITSSTEASAK